MPPKYSSHILERAYDLIVNKGYSANKTSKELKIDNGTMRKRLKEYYGLNLLPDGKKYVNSSFFDKIDTEEKAYWLGFLTADGYVSNENNIELTLKIDDINHIKLFKKSIDSKHKIGIKKIMLQGSIHTAARICIKDKNLANNLKKYGLNASKSYKAYIPFEYIPEYLIKHYIRGMFDGDGSIYKKNNGYDISFVSGSIQMKEDFAKCVKEYINIDMMPRRSRDLYEIRLFDQSKVYHFLNWIYEDSTIYLKRKYEKYCRLKSKLQKA